jgi:myo-inositol 2-dehydrogenase / D-chiro-inositol 1-dehydrogenase
MRIGLLGLGRIGAFHAETLAGLPAVEELVFSDPVPELAEQAAGRFGARIGGSPEAVLASGVDGVVIAAPTRLHADLIDLCVAAGLPTFCEKPLAHESHEAARLARRVAGTDVQVQIGCPRRFDPAFAAVRAAVAGGDLGMVHTVRSTTLDPAPPPRAYLAVSGWIFRDCAVHDYDAVRWVTGQEVIEVYAVGTNQDAEWFGELDDVHTASAVLTLDGGALAVVSNTRYNARGHDVRLEVYGTRDSLAAGLGPGLPLRSAEPGVSFPDGKPFTFFMDRLAEAFRAELTAFTEVVAGRRASPCTVHRLEVRLARGLNVLVDVEDVIGVVAALDLSEPVVVAAVGGLDPFLALVHQEVDVSPASRGGVQFLPVVACPLRDEARVGGIGVDADDDTGPASVAVGEGGGVFGDPGGSAVDGVHVHGGVAGGQLRPVFDVHVDGRVRDLLDEVGPPVPLQSCRVERVERALQHGERHGVQADQQR